MPVLFELNEADGLEPIQQISEVLKKKLGSLNYEEKTIKGPIPGPPVFEQKTKERVASKPREVLDQLCLKKEGKNAHLELKGGFGVALQYWRGLDGTCAMCLQPLLRLCGACENRDTEFEDCAVLIGECNHAIHSHCLELYHSQLADNRKCLVCRRPFATRKVWKLCYPH